MPLKQSVRGRLQAGMNALANRDLEKKQRDARYLDYSNAVGERNRHVTGTKAAITKEDAADAARSIRQFMGDRAPEMQHTESISQATPEELAQRRTKTLRTVLGAGALPFAFAAPAAMGTSMLARGLTGGGLGAMTSEPFDAITNSPTSSAPEGAIIGAALGMGGIPAGLLAGLASYTPEAEAANAKKMLQMMYRGRTGQVVPDEARALYLSPQRNYAENYALRRARQNGGAPVVDSYMVDPFNVERRYHNMLPEKGQNLTSNIAYPNAGEYEHVGFDVLNSEGMAHGGPVHMASGGALNRIRAAMSGPKSRATEIVKEPGGQWLTGSVEGALKPLKERAFDFGNTDQAVARTEAAQKWIEGPLTKYVKNRMATKDDEIRQLAEEGVLHVDPETLPWSQRTFRNREKAGYPLEGTSLSHTAGKWEDAADNMLNLVPAETYQNFGSSNMAGKPGWEWVQKLDPQTLLHGVNNPVVASNGNPNIMGLGFDHILDVIREDLGTGRLRPENLNKLSVRDAVKRAAEYNAEKAKAMESKRLADMAGIPVHKEYPENNPLGLKWVELGPESTEAGGWKRMPDGWSRPSKDQPGFHETSKDPIAAQREKLQNWLTQEGDAMGHCVGGYCDDVLSGRTKIYSLRDAKGEPHVTIEVEQSGRQPSFESMYGRPPKDDAELQQFMREESEFPVEQAIRQIKGKRNRAPNSEYLPFVQDFVKSGQWSDVGDLANTGLSHRLSDFSPELRKSMAEFGVEAPHEYMTTDEVNAVLNAVNKAKGFADGGPVESDVAAQMIDRNLDSVAAQRGVPQRMAKGGKVLPRRTVRDKIRQTLEQCTCPK